jgi:DNA-binding CsgD family transcriptional regulator/anti-anti-sigma regulatory factor
MVSPPRASLSSKRTAEGTVVARLRGAVCVGSAAGISTGILDSLGATGTALTVDLGAVTFIDRRVVPGLLLALRQAEACGHPVLVVRPKQEVWQTVERSGLAGAFPTSAGRSDTPEPDGGSASNRDSAEPATDTPTAAALTPRERQVLFELARGHTTDGAAAAIGLSPHTVRSHLKSAVCKLDAKTRVQAVALAIKQGSIEVGSRPAPPTTLDDRNAR